MKYGFGAAMSLSLPARATSARRIAHPESQSRIAWSIAMLSSFRSPCLRSAIVFCRPADDFKNRQPSRDNASRLSRPCDPNAVRPGNLPELRVTSPETTFSSFERAPFQTPREIRWSRTGNIRVIEYLLLMCFDQELAAPQAARWIGRDLPAEKWT